MMRALLVLILVAGTAPGALAAQWGNIEPGVTTMEEVRDLYGRPTRETRALVDGYDARKWIYERSQAPEGLVRLTVDFGLLVKGTYEPSVARLVTLDPKPLIFVRKTVIDGWGLPDREGLMEGLPTFIYQEGLFAMFQKDGESAVRLIFSIPQPVPAGKTAPAMPPKR
jgi:hypothetical protein